MYLGCIFLLISVRIILLTLSYHVVDAVREDLEGEHGALHLLLALKHPQALPLICGEPLLCSSANMAAVVEQQHHQVSQLLQRASQQDNKYANSSCENLCQI